MMNKYWQNFGQLNESEAFTQAGKDEFQEPLVPFEDLEESGLLDGKTPRRDFLKYLGFSTAAAALAASCEMPVRKAVPYLNRPDNVIPGVPNYYASTYVNGGDAISVVVKQRDGRPIKIEGNELCPITRGGTNAQAQASVLDLYDTTRLRHPLQRAGSEYKEVTGFDAMDNMVANDVASLGGRPLVLLTSTINSPSTQEVIRLFLAKYPGSRHVQYDAVSQSGMLLANEASHGKRALPSYNLDKAKLIVSLGADFLGTWLSPTEFNRLYAVGRKVTGEKPELSRHVQFESMMSLTGSNADDRYIHAPSQTGAIALALLQKMGGAAAGPAIADAVLNKGIEKTAALLAASKGSAVVLCGSNDANVQLVVNALNEAIGAYGTIIDFNTTNNTRKGIDADMVQLTNDMASGAIGGLLVYDCNPVYSYADSAKFAAALSRLPLSVSFNSTMDETTELCKYLIPSHHWLESWGDAEPKTGNISLIQPVINPLFKTRPFQSSLLKWAGVNTGSGMTPVTVSAVNKPDSSKASDTTGVQMAPMPAQQYTDPYENFYTKYWSGKLGSTENWEKALQDGIITNAGSVSEPVVAASITLAQPISLEAASAKIAGTKGAATEVIFYQKVSIGNGSQANNPWLQELPDPISRVTWDNYAMISPAMAKSLLNIDVLNPDHRKQADDYEVHPEKPVIKVTVNGKSLNLPAMIIPGVHPGTIAIALGYGRGGANADLNLDRVGRAATLAGANAYPMVPFDGNTFVYNAPATAVTTGDVYVLAQTQVHGSTEGRPVIYETSLASFTANPEALLEEARHERAAIIPEGKTDYRRDATMYPDYATPGIKWGMSIDLNTCTGCSACVVACIAENNISVVGKKQVARYHDMHWLRIDRYFTGDMNNPDVVYQPMLCQHCDNAPCENVCPVAATTHSSEGLNQMAYNRCIGTRYCANNCPYKVRRFNWLDYVGADSFPDNQLPMVGDVLNEVTVQMNDNLTRMVLNPDVTVRSRGVMEKCSFCVQRLQDGKLDAKKKQDPSLVRNLKTACSQACPTNAIMFGNLNDSASEVYKIRNVEQTNRNFYVLEQLHTLPSVSYLAKVRNTDRHIGIQEEEHLGELHTEGNNG